ncbi:MAG TPA: AI-2E family transporter [Polyangiaceae bacterium]|nr:AI-2E family transporter [Polyangiaceae bacterium]
MARGRIGTGITVAVLAAAAGLVLLALWAPLVLAAWIADLVQPVVRRLERALGGRRAAAGVLTVLVVLTVGVPVVTSAVVLADRVREIVIDALHAGTPEGALRDVLASGQLVKEHGAEIWRIALRLWSASVGVVVGVVVFVVTLYGLSVGGSRLYLRIARGLPIDPGVRRRIVAAFRETGRGLLVGTGGTALVQGTVAAVAYAALGVENPVTLGLLTGLGSIVPGVGTATVWLPVAVGLALMGQLVRAAILLALGLGVISTVDNVLRPWLARLGRLRLPALVVFVAMMGGWRLIGGWGLILGPLLIRLGAEALSIASGRAPPGHASGTLFGSVPSRGIAEDRAPSPGRGGSAPAPHGGQ